MLSHIQDLIAEAIYEFVMLDVIKKCLANYFTFSGRASRREFWLFAFFVALVEIVFELIRSVVSLKMLEKS